MLFFRRILYATQVFIWVLRNPEVMALDLFVMLSDLLKLIMQVATEDRHYMTEIMITVDKEVPQPIVYIWAGAGASADPHKRIKELLDENNALKEQIKRA